jgi:hypothetical protein
VRAGFHAPAQIDGNASSVGRRLRSVTQALNVIDVMKGTGVGIASELTCAVQYELLLVEKASDEHNQTDVQGWVRPTFGDLGEMVGLVMQDGTTVRFAFTGMDGTVAVEEMIPKGNLSPHKRLDLN